MLRSLLLILTFNFCMILFIDFFIQRNYLDFGKYSSIMDQKLEVKKTINTTSSDSDNVAPNSEKGVVPNKEHISLDCNPKKNQLMNKSNRLRFNYQICDSSYYICKSLRENLRLKYNEVRNEHFLTAQNDLPFLQPFISQLRDSINIRKLSKLNAAIYVVSFIQHIPYTLVHGNSHSEMEDFKFYQSQFGFNKAQAKAMAANIRRLHYSMKHIVPLDQVGGCAEETNPNGYFSPVEFLYHHMGDCDTRTLLLHTILKELGFDILELVSDHYGHAILAINLDIPYGLHHFMYLGKKYYLWETTDVHLPGIHPKGEEYLKNINSWKIKLN